MSDCEDDDQEYFEQQLESYNAYLKAAKAKGDEKAITNWNNKIKSLSKKLKSFRSHEIEGNATPVKMEGIIALWISKLFSFFLT
jgi:hypothetical protein